MDTKISIGENVKIKKIDMELKQAMQPEDYFYLKEFENKIGTIREEKESISGNHSYRVDFNENQFGYFYSDDFMLLKS